MLKFYRILLLTLVAVFLASTAGIARYAADSCTQSRMYRQLAALTENFPGDAVSTGNNFLPQYQALYTQNSDLAGWIQIDGTGINYPVMQSKHDPDFYLKHNFEKADSPHGCPYVQANCDLQTPSDNILVYGHNMKNGSMFGMLKKYRADETLYNTSKYFWILTPEKDYRYEIIAAYTTSVNSDTYTLFKGPGKEFLEYEKKMFQNSEIRTDATASEANVKDKIVTLSTCTGNQATRFVVQGKRVNAVNPQ